MSKWVASRDIDGKSVSAPESCLEGDQVARGPGVRTIDECIASLLEPHEIVEGRQGLLMALASTMLTVPVVAPMLAILVSCGMVAGSVCRRARDTASAAMCALTLASSAGISPGASSSVYRRAGCMLEAAAQMRQRQSLAKAVFEPRSSANTA